MGMNLAAGRVNGWHSALITVLISLLSVGIWLKVH